LHKRPGKEISCSLNKYDRPGKEPGRSYLRKQGVTCLYGTPGVNNECRRCGRLENIMKRYWPHIVRSTEKTVEDYLAKQVRDASRPDDGRMPSEIVEGKLTIYLLTDAVCLYFCKESKYYKDEKLFEAIKRGLSFIERWQRDDGSLDYPSCNFYSAPDTSFCFRRLYGAWNILGKHAETEEEKELENRYLVLMLRCVPILLYGGFHTPNHRWAVMSVLFTLANVVEKHGDLALEVPRYPKEYFAEDQIPKTAQELVEKLKARANQYLAEGIDGDEDGEYAERSTGNYNGVVDKSLISAYEATGNEEFLGYVERNLNMMLYYIDGDDTIFTQNSTRQDHGTKLYPDKYFYLYAYMAAKTGNPLFDAAAHKSIKDNMDRAEPAPDCMYIFMMYDWLLDYEFKGYGYLDEYRKFFRGSQVLRVKKENYVYSVLNNKAAFLFLKFGTLPIGLRIGESYCDIRNFIPKSIEVKDNGCVLKAEAGGWYYQPFREDQGTSDWWAMDHTKRDKVYTSTVAITVTISELENGLEFNVKAEGMSGLPLRVELDIPADVILENETMCLTAGKGESMILRSGELNLHDGAKKIVIGPGYGTHAFKGHYSGEERNEAGYSIFLNDYTPYDRTFRIVDGTRK